MSAALLKRRFPSEDSHLHEVPMSETIQNFEPIDLPTARRPAPAAVPASPAPADHEAPRARIVTPGEGRKAPQKKRLFIGVALSVLVVGAGMSVWLTQQGTSHWNNAPLPVREQSRASANTMHAGAFASAGQPVHGLGALKMPAAEPSPVTAKVTSAETAGTSTQSRAGTSSGVTASGLAPAPAGSVPAETAVHLAAPAQSSASVQDDAQPAPVPTQQVINLLLKRLGELEAAQKQEEAARKALGDSLDQKDTALTATMNREAGRLDEISANLHSMLIASQTPRAPETREPVVPAGAATPAPAPVRHATSITSSTSSQKREGAATTPRPEGERRIRYAIDAASPEIAIVHAAGGRAIEVRIGDVLPGYGHVKLIEQVGEAWFIRTDSGTIR